MLYKKWISEMNLFEYIIQLDSEVKLYSRKSSGNCNSTFICNWLLHKLIFLEKHDKKYARFKSNFNLEKYLK